MVLLWTELRKLESRLVLTRRLYTVLIGSKRGFEGLERCIIHRNLRPSSPYSKPLCIECLISASGVRLRSDGVAGPTASFADVHLAWIAGALYTRTWSTDY